MTAETSRLKEARSSQDDFDLWEEVTRLEADQSVRRLNPYTRSLSKFDRYEAWRHLAQQRGRRYATRSLSNYKCDCEQQTAAMKRLEEFSADMPARLGSGNGGVVLLGPPGTGKDHLLMGLMRDAVLVHGYSVKWFDGMRLFAQIKAAIKKDDVETLLDKLARVQVLAISDPVPPRDELTRYELTVLRDLIERRYSWAMATWITTNVQTAADAETLFTSALLGRLLHGATEIFCGWSNYRKPTK